MSQAMVDQVRRFTRAVTERADAHARSLLAPLSCGE
jgi:hypothetical protein